MLVICKWQFSYWISVRRCYIFGREFVFNINSFHKSVVSVHSKKQVKNLWNEFELTLCWSRSINDGLVWNSKQAWRINFETSLSIKRNDKVSTQLKPVCWAIFIVEVIVVFIVVIITATFVICRILTLPINYVKTNVFGWWLWKVKQAIISRGN